MTDIDGTLLGRDGALTPRVRSAVHALTDRGIAVVLSTARPPRTARRLHFELGLKTPLIAYNGALGYDVELGAILFHHPLERSVALRVHELISGIDSSLEIGLELADHWYVNRLDPYMAARIAAGIDEDSPKVDDLRRVLTQTDREISKVYAWISREARDAAESLFAAEGLDRHLSVTSSYAGFMEVMARGVNKGAALRTVAAILGVPREATVAIGDAENDIPALEQAGFGIAMGNAAAPVKAAAAVVALPNTEDGWAEAMERLVLAV